MYQAPLPDLRFVLEELLEVGHLGRLPRYGDFAVELLGQILEEAARFAEQVLAPLNRLGDQVGASFRDGRVQMPGDHVTVAHGHGDGLMAEDGL